MHDYDREIDNWRNLLSEETNKLKPDELVCECFCVSVIDIRNEFSTREDFNLDVLVKKFGFSNGCKSCLKDLDTKLNKIF